ncbi:MAG: hypothetical protein SPL43_02600 [Prevotella sp.]|nr:hypothetical protein [Prevotella sp.]
MLFGFLVIINQKTAGLIENPAVFSLFSVRADYLATLSAGAAAESVAAESVVAESVVCSVVSTFVVSALALALDLLPQDAKEIAATATNIKTNFFIFFAF